MKQICKHCEKRDLVKHRPGLDIDISKALESGTILPEVSLDEFNNLDIDSVQNGVRLREPFDAIEYNVKLQQSFNTEFSSGTGNIVTPSTPPAEGSGD